VTERPVSRLSADELAAEGVTALPDKEVLSLLDLNANIDLALDAAAPIDLAIGANANIAAPITAAASANLLSPDAVSAAQTDQGTAISQGITGDATATGLQDSSIDQGATAGGGTTPVDTGGGTVDTGGVTAGDTTVDGSTIDGNLLDVNVNLDGDLNLAAPIDADTTAWRRPSTA